MSEPERVTVLAHEPDFVLGRLTVSPSTCRVVSDSTEIRVEAQTMSVLIALARAQGATVPKADLIDACWQGRIVSDDAVTRTIAKIRVLARATTPDAFVLETLPKVGYRLKALAETGQLQPATGPADLAATTGPDAAVTAGLPTSAVETPAAWTFARGRLLPSIGIGLAGLVLALVVADGAQALFSGRKQQSEIVDALFAQPIRSTDVVDALLNVDEQRLKGYIRRGWNPNWHLDSESNEALHTLMLACERNPTHDKPAVLRAAQMLVRAGADVSAKNGWGDTPLAIASAPRYCGPDHPVVVYLRERVARTRQ